MLRLLLTTILFVSIGSVVLISCKKQEIGAYRNDPAIYLTNSGDSLRYSFAIQPTIVVKDTVWLNVRISGDSLAKDRAVSLTAVEGVTTAVKDLHYALPSYDLPAAKFTTRLPVVIYRTPDLQAKEVVLALHLNANDNFKTPFNNTVDFKILLNDILTKPTNWESTLEIRFGKYSNRKYKFIIDALGSEVVLKLITSGVLLNEMFFYRQKVINAWNEYVAVHGPMIDENGLTVVF